MIIYGGVKERVIQQLACDHDWHGPCIDEVSRYFKCKKCFCLDRDCETEEEYYRLVRESGEVENDAGTDE
jgi:hypothetical protein